MSTCLKQLNMAYTFTYVQFQVSSTLSGTNKEILIQSSFLKVIKVIKSLPKSPSLLRSFIFTPKGLWKPMFYSVSALSKQKPQSTWELWAENFVQNQYGSEVEKTAFEFGFHWSEFHHSGVDIWWIDFVSGGLTRSGLSKWLHSGCLCSLLVFFGCGVNPSIGIFEDSVSWGFRWLREKDRKGQMQKPFISNHLRLAVWNDETERN